MRFAVASQSSLASKYRQDGADYECDWLRGIPLIYGVYFILWEVASFEVCG